MKQKFAFFLAVVLIITGLQSVYAITDERIYTDPVNQTYTGRREAKDMISNLNFTDVSDSYWAKEAIARAGSFGMIKGDGKRFRPGGAVTNQEAVALALRVIGMEARAQEAAVNIQAAIPPTTSLGTAWAFGYLNVAMQLGLITRAQYNDALVADQTAMDPNVNFVREAPARREDVAYWVVQGLTSQNTDLFTTTQSQQSINTYSDWDNISPNRANAVESAVRTGIMQGSGGRFNPKGSMTRAEMAQVLRNLDSVYFSFMNYEKKSGTVGGILDAQSNSTGGGELARRFYVRNALGQIDILEYNYLISSSPQDGITDAVVYRNGKITGLTGLAEGDKIEYIVNLVNNTVLYVQVQSPALATRTVLGNLGGVDVGKSTITLTDLNSKTFTYALVDGLLTEDGANNYVFISDKKRDVKQLPIGAKLELRLKNEVVDRITYLGDPVVEKEGRGIVIENNPAMGYLTFRDNSNRQVTKGYYSGDIKVKKRRYYNTQDDIGYLDRVFPNFQYNPLEANISEIEAGDIIFYRTDPKDANTIIDISAATDYVARYGKIKQFIPQAEISSLVIEYEDKQTAMFDIANDVFISKDGKPISSRDVMAGDWARILVNQAVIGSGNIMESVKEIKVEGDEHFISNIVKGQLTGLNPIQKQLEIKNAQSLGKAGWGNYKNLQKFSISAPDIEYYQDGNRISLDFAMQYLKRADGEVYLALENSVTGERVRKVTFRTGRDELLNPDTVISADGSGSFSLTGGYVATDNGTIVRRHGRLVDGQNIMAPDYAFVSLNGAGKAAVVDIVDPPDTSGVIIARGRIMSVNDGQSFKVHSMSVLTGNEWAFTPVQREFTIDYDTLFLDTEGYVDRNKFIGYTQDSVVDKVYYFVTDGTKATHVVDAPYAVNMISGVIYENSADSLNLKDATYYTPKTGKWTTVSTKDATASVATDALNTNCIIVKNNKVVLPNALQVGDRIRVLTEALPPVAPGMEVTPAIILVDK